MQGSAIPEVMARIWDLMEAGDEKAARAIEQKVNVFEAALFAVQTIQGVKEVLVRRGIFSSSALRGGEPRRLDADLMHDLDAALELLRPWLRELPA
jgi:dihydrodipicolinate synthase/N-acetylneuraminate lyase